MHLWIVETVFHRSPSIVEHLGPFGWTIDTHTNIETNPPAPSACTCSCHCACACACACRQRYGIDAIAFAEEQRTAVSRNVQFGKPATKTSASAWPTLSVLGRWL